MRDLWALALVVFSCGGATTRGSEPANAAGMSSTASSGGTSSDSSGTSGEAGLSNSEAGTAGSFAEIGGAASAGAAGSAPAESPAVKARNKSGTRFCLDDADCNGLICTPSLGRVQSACLAPCTSDLDCKVIERCFSQPSIPTSCFHRCLSPEDCDYQYDCADYYGTGDYLCLPSDWVRYWAPSMP